MLTPEQLKAVRKIQIRTSHLVSDLFAGQYQSVFKGHGMEFAEVRHYLPGDDIRTIDWNVTARTGVPHVKRFVEERELTVMLLVDASASTHVRHRAAIEERAGRGAGRAARLLGHHQQRQGRPGDVHRPRRAVAAAARRAPATSCG